MATTNNTASGNQRNLTNLVCRDSHHHDMSLIFVCQDIGYKNVLTTLKKNSHYHCSFVNHTNNANMIHLAKAKGMRVNRFNEIYTDIKDKPNSYLFFDGKKDSYINARCRTGIMPNDDTIVYPFLSFINKGH